MTRARLPHVPPACSLAPLTPCQAIPLAGKNWDLPIPGGLLKAATAVGSAWEAGFLRLVTFGQRDALLSYSPYNLTPTSNGMHSSRRCVSSLSLKLPNLYLASSHSPTTKCR